jgi:hypothetical protein
MGVTDRDAEQSYRFTDRDGGSWPSARTTPMVARASSVAEWSSAARLLSRRRHPLSVDTPRRDREMFQIGAELVGDASPEPT